ncbi:MAG: hypothetical protein V1661_01245 [bacterium]
MENVKCGKVFLFVLALMIFSIPWGNKSEAAARKTFGKIGKTKIMLVKDVKPGMTGYGLTVYRGALPEKFFFKVLGVKKMLLGASSDSPVIIAQLTAGPKDFPPEKTGVVAGMSGSPVYINGKLVGALAFSFTEFPKDPIFGIQPAEIMLNPRSGVKTTGALSISDNKYIPLVLSMPAGIADSLLKTNRPDGNFLKNNFVIQAAVGSSSAASAGGNLRLRPGSSLAVYLIRGDIALAASGTVTMVDGDKIYAFGHPFLGKGETELPFHQNEIITINSSYERSSKMSGGEVGTVEGTITDDNYAAISGSIGKMPRMVSIKVALCGIKGCRTINIEVIRSRDFTMRLINVAVPQILLTAYGEIGFGVPRAKQKMNTITEIAFGNRAQTLAMEKSFNVSENFPLRGYDAISKYSDLLESALTAIIRKNALDMVSGIDIKIVVAEMEEKNSDSAKAKKLEIGAMSSVAIKGINAKGAAIPGKTFAADVLLSVAKGKEKTTYTITMAVPIPKDVPLGDGKITISASSGFELADDSDTNKMNLEETIAYYNNLCKPGLFITIEYQL